MRTVSFQAPRVVLVRALRVAKLPLHTSFAYAVHHLEKAHRHRQPNTTPPQVRHVLLMLSSHTTCPCRCTHTMGGAHVVKGRVYKDTTRPALSVHLVAAVTFTNEALNSIDGGGHVPT